MRSNPQDSPWVVMIESSTVVSEEYSIVAVCRCGIVGQHTKSLDPYPVIAEAAPPCRASPRPGRWCSAIRLAAAR